MIIYQLLPLIYVPYIPSGPLNHLCAIVARSRLRIPQETEEAPGGFSFSAFVA